MTMSMLLISGAVKAVNKRITFHGFKAAECPESNNHHFDPSSESDSSEYDGQSDNSELTRTPQRGPPAPTAQKIAPLVRSQSDGSIHSNSLREENGSPTFRRSLDDLTSTSSEMKLSNRVASPEFEQRNIVEYTTDQMGVVKQGKVQLVSSNDNDSNSDESCHREMNTRGSDSPVISMSPVENPQKISLKLNGVDHHDEEQSSEKELDDAVDSLEESEPEKNNNAPIACSPRISVNLNRWVSLNR